MAAVADAGLSVDQIDGFTTGDAIAQTTSLLAVLALPWLAVATLRSSVRVKDQGSP